jgi:translation initiation factor IF-1
MGTVQMRHDNHLQVTGIDGKTSMIAVDEKTKILRGKTRVKADEIKPGDRIVVTATETTDKDGQVALVATEIRLGARGAAASK